MAKKKIFLIISSLFILLVIAFLFIFNEHKATRTSTSQDSSPINTSQLKGDTTYASNDTSSEYNKMLEEAKIQETIKKEKAKKEKEQKEKEQKTTKKSSTEQSSTEQPSTTVTDGVTYEKVNQYVSKPEDTASKTKVKITSKTKKQNATEGLEPSYKKWFFVK